ncbi:MAG: hypothetical protein KatS3mg068_1284 [Candidatus Sericytochromatia bacterium]|nr:MAG: hypothetical protein KatS3mg068_1284 [Candidatus Sericytochromatia bacterium]
MNLLSFLKLIKSEGFQKQMYILLKDIHNELNDIKVISAIKDIVEKNMYLENYYATIFIISSKLNIPKELENYITIVDMPSPSLNEIEEIIRNYCKDLEVSISEEEVSELAIDLKGLSEFQIIQILNLAYQNQGQISLKDKNLILEEKKTNN